MKAAFIWPTADPIEVARILRNNDDGFQRELELHRYTMPYRMVLVIPARSTARIEALGAERESRTLFRVVDDQEREDLGWAPAPVPGSLAYRVRWAGPEQGFRAALEWISGTRGILQADPAAPDRARFLAGTLEGGQVVPFVPWFPWGRPVEPGR